MSDNSQKILLLGSNVLISSLPIKEVSLLHEGSLPAYGYNPGDSLELLAGQVSVEEGRQEQCLTWLNSLKDEYMDRNGGYTRIIRTGNRLGDAAPMAILELVNYTEDDNEGDATEN